MNTTAPLSAMRSLRILVLLCLASCVKTNTIVKHILDTDTLVIVRDTIKGDISIVPSGGDDYPQLQKTIDSCVTHPGHRILLGAGHYLISHPLIVAHRSGNDYSQVTIDIEGATNAKDAPDAFCSTIIPLFTNTFALGIQQGKGCTISNIAFMGKYSLPTHLNMIQIDSLSWQGWSDGVCSDGRTNPYSGIVIDPFSDPVDYSSDANLYPKYQGLDSFYLPGMSRSGSTAINISGCRMRGFVVGVMLTPSYQQNGELINVQDCQIDFCRVCYGYTQTQAKANQLDDLMCWGGVHTVLDGLHFGFVRGDGSTAPAVNVMSIAGGVYELINSTASSYPITLANVFAQQLFKLGEAGGSTVTNFNNFQVNFQLSPGLPSPDFYFMGYHATFTGCMLRVYNGRNIFNRIIMNYPGTTFDGGLFSSPPVAVFGQGFTPGPQFTNVVLYYTGGYLNRNDYDTVRSISSSQLIRVDRSTYNGYFVSNDAASLVIGDVLLTAKLNEGGGTPPYSQPIMNYQYPLGFVSSVSRDTVFLQSVGVGIRDSVLYPVWVDRIK